MVGYIKLYRDIQEHWIWEDKPYSKGQAWIDLLMMANHEENKVVLGNEIILVERGCLITSEVKLAERWGWSRCKVRAFLELLKNDSMIDKKSDSKKTYLKVLNYTVWQDSETTKNHQKDSVQTSKRQRSDTNKNEKNIKNEKKDIYSDLISSFTSDPELTKTIYDFIDMRKTIKKPMTTKALQLLLKKLTELSSDTATQIKILEQSIVKNWLSVFPLKEEQKPKKSIIEEWVKQGE